jgi:hypothetical protein
MVVVAMFTVKWGKVDLSVTHQFFGDRVVLESSRRLGWFRLTDRLGQRGDEVSCHRSLRQAAMVVRKKLHVIGPNERRMDMV